MESPLPSTRALPLQQARLLSFAAEYYDTHSIPPSNVEMCRALRVSKKSPTAYIKPLLNRGLLQYAVKKPRPGKRGPSRNLIVSPAGREWLAQMGAQTTLTFRSSMVRYKRRTMQPKLPLVAVPDGAVRFEDYRTPDEFLKAITPKSGDVSQRDMAMEVNAS